MFRRFAIVLGVLCLAFSDVPSTCAEALYAVTDLGRLPGGSYSQANGINASGQVVGDSSTSTFLHAFLYSNGKMADLGTLPGGSYSSANDINTSGQVVGYAAIGSGSGNYHAFLYSNGMMSDLGPLSGFSGSDAYGINTSGQVVGWAFTTVGGVISNERAFLYSNGTMTDLTGLIDPSSGWTLEEANAINDSGQIVGIGINASGNADAFLLTPTPEPSTLAFLLTGVIALLGYAWRRRAM